MINLISHMTDKERQDAIELLESPDVDIDVMLELSPECSISEVAHWSTQKKIACHRLKVPEPAFTKDEFIEICAKETEEEKRSVFTKILTGKIKNMNVTINAEDIPKANRILDQINATDKLIKLLEDLDRLKAEKKATLKGYRDAIESIESAISQEVLDIKSGQKNLFDKSESVQ